jgi:hypothetical protein
MTKSPKKRSWWGDDELALVTMGSPHQLRISRRYRRGHFIIVRCCTCAYNGTCRAFVAASHCEYTPPRSRTTNLSDSAHKS